jgi:hypothetical protein
MYFSISATNSCSAFGLILAMIRVSVVYRFSGTRKKSISFFFFPINLSNIPIDQIIVALHELKYQSIIQKKAGSTQLASAFPVGRARRIEVWS